MPITIRELAIHRGAQEVDGTMNGAEFDRVGLSIMGGCQGCNASLAAYNAYPTTLGYWCCVECVRNMGWETVEDADRDIFEEAS